MASSSSSDEQQEFREIFSFFDKDQGGSIDATELGAVLRKFGHNFSDSDLRKIISRFDDNGDGVIDFSEFSKMMATPSSRQEDEGAEDAELHAVFKVFDKDGDGTISVSEIDNVMRMLGEKIDRSTLEMMIEAVDVDKNGSRTNLGL